MKVIIKTKEYVEVEDATDKDCVCELKVTNLITREKITLKLSPENLIDLKCFLEKKLIQMAVLNIM